MSHVITKYQAIIQFLDHLFGSHQKAEYCLQLPKYLLFYPICLILECGKLWSKVKLIKNDRKIKNAVFPPVASL